MGINRILFLRSHTPLVLVGAIIMGFVSGKLLLFRGSAANILPWGILTLLTARLATTKREALKLGGVFGFVVSFSYLWFNNTDPKTPFRIVNLTVAAGIAALFGLLCGVILGLSGWKLRHLYNKKRLEGR